MYCVYLEYTGFFVQCIPGVFRILCIVYTWSIQGSVYSVSLEYLDSVYSVYLGVIGSCVEFIHGVYCSVYSVYLEYMVLCIVYTWNI